MFDATQPFVLNDDTEETEKEVKMVVEAPKVVTASPKAHKKRWTVEEVEALKVGLKTHGKDFAAIARDVGTKTKEQVNFYYRNHKVKQKLDDLLAPSPPKPEKTKATTPKRKADDTPTPAKRSKKAAAAAAAAPAAVAAAPAAAAAAAASPTTEVAPIELRPGVEKMPLVSIPVAFSACSTIALRDPSGNLMVFDMSSGFLAVQDDGGAATPATKKKKNKRKAAAIKS
jgi:hypothetical protein